MGKIRNKINLLLANVDWLGVVGIILVILGIGGIIFAVYYNMRLPWMEQAWPTLQILFGVWVIIMRRNDLRFASWIPLVSGLVFRGLQFLLNPEGWEKTGMFWPAALLVAGIVWVVVSSPAIIPKEGENRWRLWKKK